MVFPHIHILFIYAFFSLSFCLLLTYIFVQKKNQSCSFISFILLAGLSAAFKFDFILILFIPLYGLIKLFIRQKSFKTFIAGALCLTAPFLISILVYLISGGTFSDLHNEVNFYWIFQKHHPL